MSSSSSFYQPITRWRNTERVTVLNHKIEELEEHTTGPLPNRTLEFFECGGCRSSPYTNVYSTTQLLFILSLEKELDDELRLPLEYSQDEENRITNYEKVLGLQKQISEIAKETDNEIAHTFCGCNFSLSTTTATNLLLLKEILTRRLKREMPIGNSTRMYSYGAVERPTTDTQEMSDKIKKWRKDILKLKSQKVFPSSGPNINDENGSYYLRSLYNSVKVRDLENKIKLNSTANNHPNPVTKIVNPPPYYQQTN